MRLFQYDGVVIACGIGQFVGQDPRVHVVWYVLVAAIHLQFGARRLGKQVGDATLTNKRGRFVFNQEQVLSIVEIWIAMGNIKLVLVFSILPVTAVVACCVVGFG